MSLEFLVRPDVFVLWERVTDIIWDLGFESFEKSLKSFDVWDGYVCI